MEITIVPSPGEASRLAGAYIASIVRSSPVPVLGLATGSTPIGLY